MANLTETNTYPAGVYQLERTDPVDAGVSGSGLANLQALQLASRTNYLKQVLDAVGLDLANTSLRVPNAAIASLPPASANTRKLFFATDANAGAGVLVISNGTNWVDIRTGTTVTTAATAGIGNASDSVAGIVQLAINSEGITGTNTTKAVTPAVMRARIEAIPTASTSTPGLISLASSSEVTAGTEATKAVTSATLKTRLDSFAPPAASTSTAGIIQIATPAQVRALSVNDRTITPLALAGLIPSMSAAQGQFARVNAAGDAFAYSLENTTSIVSVAGGTFTALANRYHFFSSACTVTLPTTPPEGTFIAFFNSQGSGTVTLSATGTNAHNATLAASSRAYLVYVNSNWRNLGFTGGAFTASGSAVFSYTGSNQTWTVPAGVTSATGLLWAGGGGGGDNAVGGGSGFCQATFSVTPAESITVVVGQGGFHQGTAGTSAAAFGGGGTAVKGTYGSCGSGGGRSAIRRSSTELLTAGAGGGGATTNVGGFSEYAGGVGGGNAGGGGGGGTAGGTQSAGGAASNIFGGNAASGGLLTGGNGATTATNTAGWWENGAGGGSGYYGGAGTDSYGGGGGSSFTGSGTTNPSSISGSGQSAANNAHPSYASGVGNGGAGGGAGGNGRVVILWG